jgi:hypothetical protein
MRFHEGKLLWRGLTAQCGVSVGEAAKLFNDLLMLDHEVHPAGTS